MNDYLMAHSATNTHAGHRRSVNEDAALADTQRGLWVVADGMGGYAAGDVASQMVVHSIDQVQLTGSLDQDIARIEEAILSANRRLFFDTTLPPGCSHIGTTVTVLFYHPDENICVCLWVGDSRLYVLRDNGLYQLTRDHSVVQEMVDNGVLDESRRDDHPQSHVITRAIGVSDELKVDTLRFQPQSRDLYVLCSDGLYNEISIAGALQDHCEILSFDACLKSRKTADCLIDAALSTAARDNITVTVVAIE